MAIGWAQWLGWVPDVAGTTDRNLLGQVRIQLCPLLYHDMSSQSGSEGTQPTRVESREGKEAVVSCELCGTKVSRPSCLTRQVHGIDGVHVTLTCHLVGHRLVEAAVSAPGPVHSVDPKRTAHCYAQFSPKPARIEIANWFMVHVATAGSCLCRLYVLVSATHTHNCNGDLVTTGYDST